MAIINVDDAYILDNSGAQVDESVDYAYANGNRNLLDNPFFRINQRGWTSGTANAAFTVDRWKMSSAYGTKQVTVNADGTITFNGLFFQKIEPHFIAGQVVTISYMTADGNVVSKTGTIGTTEGYAVGNAAFGLYYRPSTGVCDFQIQAEDLTLRACKVELGPYSTIVNDTPPELSTARIPCYENFLRLKGAYAPVGYAIAVSPTLALVVIPTPVTMRVLPSASLSGTLYFNAGTPFAVTGLASNGTTLGVNQITQQVTGSFETGKVYLAQFRDASSYIDLSADL